MNKRITAALTAALLVLGTGSAFAKLPAPPPLTEEQKAAEAAKKAKAEEAKKREAAELDKAMDRAVENYKRNKGMTPATMATAPAKK